MSNGAHELDDLLALLSERDAAELVSITETLATDERTLEQLLAQAEAEDHATLVELGIEPADAPFDVELAALVEGEPNDDRKDPDWRPC